MRRVVLGCVLLVLCACLRADTVTPDGSDPPEFAAIEPALLRGRLPDLGGDLAPALTQLAGSGLVDGQVLTSDADGCAACHADVAAQFRASAHAFASFNNPIYRASVDEFRAASASGAERSRFCGGCHDIPLHVDRAMAAPVAPSDPRAHGGVTCLSCHAVDHATQDGNGSYHLSTDAIPLPDQHDPALRRAHSARLAPPALRDGALCASCHRAFLSEATGHGAHMAGADDVGPWMRSVFAGSNARQLEPVEVPRRSCTDCHMPSVAAPLGDAAARDGTVRSHHFAGGHTWLASMRGDDAALARARAMLAQAVRLWIVPRARKDGTRDLDVVLRNVGVGHHFPGGTRDAQDTWIELEVADAEGVIVARARSGAAAHRLVALVVDDNGQPAVERDVHRFRTVVYDHTIAPRDAAVVRYRLRPLSAARGPLTVSAKLWHRSRSFAVQNVTCEATTNARGVAFARAARGLGLPVLDGCAPQPVTLVAMAETSIREEPASGALSDNRARERPAMVAQEEWQRLYDHGLGWTHALVEQLDEARPSLEKSLRVAPSSRHRAASMVLLARVAGRQGRVEEALRWAREAEELAGSHPAIDATRGDALARAWRWPQAAEAYERAALRAPRDDRLWGNWSKALGSAGDPAASLAAAHVALAYNPRQPDLLRQQARALRELAPESPSTVAALDSFLHHRRRDDGPALRAQCSQKVRHCARERVAVHVHNLIP